MQTSRAERSARLCVWLEAAYAAEPMYPEAATQMITVCMGEDGRVDDARVWFDRAIAAQIDDMDAWNAYAETPRPRWGGTLDALQALGHEAAMTKRYDTVVPFFVTRATKMMTEENGAGDSIYRRRGVWTDIASVYDGYLNPLAAAIEVTWVGTNRAGYAWRCGQFAEAKRTLDVLGEQARPDAIETFGITLPELREQCAAMTGPHAADFRSAAEDEAAFAFEMAVDLYDGLLAKKPAGDPSRAMCVRRRLAASLDAELTAGRVATVPLTGPDDLTAFTGDTAPCSINTSELIFAGPASSTATLLHRAAVPGRVRIKLDWQWSTPQAGHAPGFDVVLQDTQREGLISVRHFPRDNVVCVDMGKFTFLQKRPPKDPVALPAGAWHTVDIEHDGATVTVTEDGVVLVAAYANDWLAFGKPALGLVAHASSVGGEIRVRNLTVETIR